MDDREYLAGSAAAEPKPAARRLGRSALVRTAVVAATVAGLGLAPAVAGAAETAVPAAQAAPVAQAAPKEPTGIESGFLNKEGCENRKVLFGHNGLGTYGCFYDNILLWHFYWWQPVG